MYFLLNMEIFHCYVSFTRGFFYLSIGLAAFGRTMARPEELSPKGRVFMGFPVFPMGGGEPWQPWSGTKPWMKKDETMTSCSDIHQPKGKNYERGYFFEI